MFFGRRLGRQRRRSFCLGSRQPFGRQAILHSTGFLGFGPRARLVCHPLSLHLTQAAQGD
jgi:hypothetical protein